MSAEPTLVLHSDAMRAKAVRWVCAAPRDTAIVFRKPKRTLPQNDKLHAMLTELAPQVEWGGKRRSVEDWKDIFTAALKSQQSGLEVVPGIEGGFVLLGMHTADLRKDDFADLITLVEMFCARRGIMLRDQRDAA